MVRATSPVLSMGFNKLKLNEEKSEHAGSTQQNGFGSTFLHNLVRLVNVAAAALTPAREACNKQLIA
jgi:hypothetical protein